MPHLAVLKRISMVLQLRATAALAAGKSEAALADIRLMFRLADSVKSEPFPISYLLRIAIIEIALEPVWEGMIQHRWDERQLQELDQDLKGDHSFPDEVRAIRGDRAFANAFLDRLAADSVERDKLLAQLSPPPGAEPGEDPLPFALIAWGPRGWVRQNQVAQAARFQDVIEDSLSATNLAAKRGQSTSSITEKWNKRLGASTPYNRIARLLVRWSGYLSALWAQTAVNLARTACGLERYRLANGTYPPNLEALVPQVLGQRAAGLLQRRASEVSQDRRRSVRHLLGGSKSNKRWRCAKHEQVGYLSRAR